MDRVIDELSTIVLEEIAGYSRLRGYKATSYLLTDENSLAYAWVVVPSADHPMLDKPKISIMARIVSQYVVIEQDTTDKPLYEELLRRGIPRENIVLAYAGERLPEEKGDDS